jgi:hypothetical protein
VPKPNFLKKPREIGIFTKGNFGINCSYLPNFRFFSVFVESLLFASFRPLAFLVFFGFYKKTKKSAFLVQNWHVARFSKARRVCTRSAFLGPYKFLRIFSGNLAKFRQKDWPKFIRGVGLLGGRVDVAYIFHALVSARGPWLVRLCLAPMDKLDMSAEDVAFC